MQGFVLLTLMLSGKSEQGIFEFWIGSPYQLSMFNTVQRFPAPVPDSMIHSDLSELDR